MLNSIPILADTSDAGLRSIFMNAPPGNTLWVLVGITMLMWVIMFRLFIKAMRTASGHRQMLLTSPALAVSYSDEGPYSVNTAIGLYLLLVFTMILSVIVAVATHEPDPAVAMRNYIFFEVASIAACAAFAWRDLGPSFRRLGSKEFYLMAPLFGTATFLLATVWLMGTKILLGTREMSFDADLEKAGLSVLGVFFLGAVFTPAIEEIAFRGIMIPVFRRALSEKETLVVVSLMFMSIHFSIICAPHLILLAWICGWVRLRSGSIWPCILIHAIHNSLCFAAERWHF